MCRIISNTIRLIGRGKLTRNPEDINSVEMNQQKQVCPARCIITSMLRNEGENSHKINL